MSDMPTGDPNLRDQQMPPAGDGPQAGENFEAKVQQEESELRRLQDERDALFERLARATADFKNIQKRLQQDKDQAVQFANSQLIKTLLPVIDNFERGLAVDASKSDAASILKGMQIVHDQWMNVLKQQAVEEIAPAPGTPFDPAQHSALMQQADERFKDSAEPVVTQLLQKGYMHHGRVLRPAAVAVSKTS